MEMVVKMNIVIPIVNEFNKITLDKLSVKLLIYSKKILV
ncbi:hypothetical protein XBKQ1_2860028 [Xenorhabdus bovienii str. kraussei Quebec]|uniref:Uncharacterized protein n=2 Tax=Xenorhabdus bovienii TaxID=40576 RepID=A0A077PJR3_XENBV|nr:hypothetical protein XBFFR1_1490082 [Xenorhabdus bovienii str. feltiae France]CDG92909.1 hypothetical protein XBFFL1_2370014 [Xenorhabdus bovienii str. feltiae Florida]CDH02307.1 hypothetical protein XBFM1_2600022 [Xenorhabdus bovienii str. feltiae Moldova]CDH20966.1 hypothetical protein XBKQ1_2860028 [Xenorhabdus bovienii str. kraussei Quebec]